MVADNDVLYEEYFAWKKFYGSSSKNVFITNALRVAADRSVWNSPCHICEALFVRLFKTHQLKKKLSLKRSNSSLRQ